MRIRRKESAVDRREGQEKSRKFMHYVRDETCRMRELDE